MPTHGTTLDRSGLRRIGTTGAFIICSHCLVDVLCVAGYESPVIEEVASAFGPKFLAPLLSGSKGRVTHSFLTS
jgi:hypothetical protein